MGKVINLWDARGPKMSDEDFAAAKKVVDEIVRDVFAHGGPQRPTSIGVYREKSKVTVLLETEQRRLVHTWNKREKEDGDN